MGWMGGGGKCGSENVYTGASLERMTMRIVYGRHNIFEAYKSI